MQVYFQYNALCQLCKLFYSFHSSRLLPVPFPVSFFLPCTVSCSVSPVIHLRDMLSFPMSLCVIGLDAMSYIPVSFPYIHSKPPCNPFLFPFPVFSPRFLSFPFSFPYILF